MGIAHRWNPMTSKAVTRWTVPTLREEGLPDRLGRRPRVRSVSDSDSIGSGPWHTVCFCPPSRTQTSRRLRARAGRREGFDRRGDPTDRRGGRRLGQDVMIRRRESPAGPLPVPHGPGAIRRVLGFLRPHRGSVAVAAALTVLACLLNLPVPFLVQGLVDRVVDRRALVRPCRPTPRGCSPSSPRRRGWRWPMPWSSAGSGQGVVRDLRHRLYDRLQRLGPGVLRPDAHRRRSSPG